MSKELKALEEVKTYIDDNITTKYNHVEPEIKFIESALKRLEAIDNASSSEALKCLEIINNYGCGINDNMKFSEVFEKEYNTIKQTLITKSKKEEAFDWLVERIKIIPREWRDPIMQHLKECGR